MERKDKTKLESEILNAVILCKYESEGGPIQITQVAAKAGISTRTLNRYFPEKDEMICTAAALFLNRKYAEFAEKYASFDKSALNGREKLMFFLRSQKDYYKADPVNAVLFVDANINCIRLGVKKGGVQTSFGKEIREIVVSSISEGQADGSVKLGIDPEATALLISANFNGLMQKLTFTYRSDLPENKKTQAYSIFDEYLKMLELYLMP